jgi:hypothetical protein
MKKKMAMLACLFCLILLAFSSALANLRAPRQVDGFLSGGLNSSDPAAGIIFSREEMRISFPDMDSRKLTTAATVHFAIVYELENSQAQAVIMPVYFIAVDIQSPQATLNGEPLSLEIRGDPAEKSEFLRRLARHRSSFLPRFYTEFLERVRREAGLGSEPADSWLSELEKKDLSALPVESVFDRMSSESQPQKDLPLVGFALKLKPGKNTLVLNYEQRFYVEERGHGYFASWPSKGVSGFDYLLYPSRTWKLHQDFRLDITIALPDFHKKRFFIKSWKRPQIKSNLDFAGDYNSKKHLAVYKGSYRNIPADILTFLVWVDKKAPNYLL